MFQQKKYFTRQYHSKKQQKRSPKCSNTKQQQSSSNNELCWLYKIMPSFQWNKFESLFPSHQQNNRQNSMLKHNNKINNQQSESHHIDFVKTDQLKSKLSQSYSHHNSSKQQIQHQQKNHSFVFKTNQKLFSSNSNISTDQKLKKRGSSNKENKLQKSIKHTKKDVQNCKCFKFHKHTISSSNIPINRNTKISSEKNIITRQIQKDNEQKQINNSQKIQTKQQQVIVPVKQSHKQLFNEFNKIKIKQNSQINVGKIKKNHHAKTIQKPPQLCTKYLILNPSEKQQQIVISKTLQSNSSSSLCKTQLNEKIKHQRRLNSTVEVNQYCQQNSQKIELTSMQINKNCHIELPITIGDKYQTLTKNSHSYNVNKSYYLGLTNQYLKNNDTLLTIKAGDTYFEKHTIVEQQQQQQQVNISYEQNSIKEQLYSQKYHSKFAGTQEQQSSTKKSIVSKIYNFDNQTIDNLDSHEISPFLKQKFGDTEDLNVKINKNPYLQEQQTNDRYKQNVYKQAFQKQIHDHQIQWIDNMSKRLADHIKNLEINKRNSIMLSLDFGELNKNE